MTCICVDTLAALGTTAISVDIPTVVVGQFDGGSAPSAAVYIRTGSNPGHPLSIYNDVSIGGPQWWTIHPDYVTLEAAGAPPAPGDCAGAMQNVLLYLAAVTRASLKLGARDYVLGHAATFFQSDPSTDPVLYFSIIGRGRGVSRLLIPYNGSPPEPLGAFAIIFSLKDSEFLAQDFSVIATGATESNSGCGTAMLVNYSGSGAPDRRGAIVSHVEIGNDDQYAPDGICWSYFAKGIDLTGIPRPLVSGVSFSGCTGDIASTDFSDGSARYLVQAHLVLDECYSPHVIDCEMWHATVGISSVSTSRPQGFFVANSHIEGVITALLHTQAGDNPVGRLIDNDVQFRDVGFDLANISRWRVSGNQFRNEWGDGAPAGTSYDMRFRASFLIMLTGNSFVTIANTARVNILVDADTNVGGSGNFAYQFLIDSHQFGEIDAGHPVCGISAIQIMNVTGTASDIQIGASNQFVGTYSGSVVDDARSVAVTMVGFPCTSTSTPPTAVPNGNPTLGSAGVAWSQSYSLGHYVPQPLTNPPFPGGTWAGWVIYTDEATGNLVAYKGSGTPTTLAS